MLEGGHVGLAAAYAVASLAGGFAPVFLATKLVRRARLWPMSFVALWLAASACSAGWARSRASCSTRLVSLRRSRRFPLGTLLVNLSGALVLGLFCRGSRCSGDAYLLAGTAVIGSYTTFSTWMLESHRLGRGRPALAARGERRAQPGCSASARRRSAGCSGAADARGRAAADRLLRRARPCRRAAARRRADRRPTPATACGRARCCAGSRASASSTGCTPSVC